MAEMTDPTTTNALTEAEILADLADAKERIKSAQAILDSQRTR